MIGIHNGPIPHPCKRLLHQELGSKGKQSNHISLSLATLYLVMIINIWPTTYLKYSQRLGFMERFGESKGMCSCPIHN